MSLFGNLEDLPLPYLLQTIAGNRMTGKLVLTRRDGHGLIVFRSGKIIYAATNSAREAFGNILVLRKLITVSTLTEALRRQVESTEERRLGTILLEMGAVDLPSLARVMTNRSRMSCSSCFAGSGDSSSSRRWTSRSGAKWRWTPPTC